MALNVTTAVFAENCNTATASPSLAQWDTEQVLQISGIDLPDSYKVEFSTVYTRNAIPAIGDASGVAIPNVLLQRSAPITAYVVLYGENGGRNREYWITIHITPGQPPETITPDPEQEDVIDQAIAALNSGVARTEAAAEAAEGSARDAEAAAVAVQNLSVAAETLATGEPATVEKTVDEETGTVTLKFGLPRGVKGDPLTYEDLTPEQKAELVQGPILEAQDAAVTAVGNARASAVDAVEAAGTTQVNAVNQTGAAQVTAVNQAGATQVQAVEDKGEEVLDSIPQDYTDLVDDVAYLSRQLNDETTGLDTKAPVILETASGAIASFSDGADGLPMKSLVAAIEPVQAGTGEPSPDNIRPISGWTGMTGQRTGKNLLEITATTVTKNGVTYTVNKDSGNNIVSISLTGTSTGKSELLLNNAVYLPNGGIITGAESHASSNASYRIRVGKTSDNSFVTNEIGSGANIPALSDGTYNIKILVDGVGITFNYTVYPMIRLASDSDSTFEPYEGDTISVNWQSQAGTVYGGSDELIGGHLTADRVIADMGDLTWTLVEGTVNRFRATPTPQMLLANNRTLDIKCSCYKSNVGGGAYELYTVYNVNNDIYVVDDSYGTAADFKTAVTGQSVVYPLAAPIEYQLTPQEVTTLLGNNVVYTDVGPVSVEYPADTKLYIEQLTKPTEDDMTADHAIAAGTFFQLGNSLYLATAAIAAGATITPGTNATKLSLADALNTLNS